MLYHHPSGIAMDGNRMKRRQEDYNSIRAVPAYRKSPCKPPDTKCHQQWSTHEQKYQSQHPFEQQPSHVEHYQQQSYNERYQQQSYNEHYQQQLPYYEQYHSSRYNSGKESNDNFTAKQDHRYRPYSSANAFRLEANPRLHYERQIHSVAGAPSSQIHLADDNLFTNYNAKKKNITNYQDRNGVYAYSSVNIESLDPQVVPKPENVNMLSHQTLIGNYNENPTASYSMPVQKYEKSAEGQAKCTKPDPFAKTLAIYASTWMKNKNKTRMPSESSDTSNSHLRLLHEGDSADFPIKSEKMIELAPYLHVDLNSLTPDQFYLTVCYFRSQRTIRQFYYRKILKIDEKFRLNDVYDSDEECAPDDTLKYLVDKNPDYLSDVKPLKSQKNHKNCDHCLLWNLAEREYLQHIKSDLHLLITDQLKLPPFSGAQRYDMVWCFGCSCYFMLNFNGNTLVGHQQDDKHVKMGKLFGTRHKKSLNARDFCLVTHLKGTMLHMLPPSDCRYQIPKEAYASYTRVYKTMLSRGLVIS